MIVKQSNPDTELLVKLGVFARSLLSKEESAFHRINDSEETCYPLE